MPRHKNSIENIQDEDERFFVEQARSYYRDLRVAAENAPFGKIIQHVEQFTQKNGKELIRQSFEKIVQEQNDILEKKKNSASATADANANTADTDTTKP